VPGGREPFEVVPEPFVQQLLLAEQVAELLALAARGQVAEDEQVGGLDEGAVLGQLLDGVAAIAQDAVFAVVTSLLQEPVLA
jgi:hypothetical protein